MRDTEKQTASVNHCCPEMERRLADPDVGVAFFEKYREYGIAVVTDTSIMRIAYCPWCGSRLPESLRDRRYAELESMGIVDPYTQGVPPEFETAEWWLRRGVK